MGLSVYLRSPDRKLFGLQPKRYAPGTTDDFTTFRQVLWPLWTISQTGACSPPALPAFSSLFALRMPQPAREATPRGSIHSRTGR